MFISLHIRSMWETICDAQAGFWLNSKFLSKFSRKPLSGISDQKAPPPFRKTSDLRWPKFTLEYPPILENSDLRWPKFTLEYSPPPFFWKTSDLKWPKFTPETPPVPSPFQKTSDLRWPKFTPEYPPILENLRFEMTKVYSRIPPPHFRKCGRSYVETNL